MRTWSRQVGAVFSRELYAFAVTPLMYVLAAVFLFLTGLLFSLVVYNGGEESLTDLFYHEILVLTLVVPLLTMRLLAQERREGTMDLLLAHPIYPGALVWGKFSATSLILVLVIGGTAVFPAWLTFWWPLDWGALGVSYAGLVCTVLAMCGVGTAFSALCGNPLVAALLTFVALLMPLFLGYVGTLAGGFLEPVLTLLSPFTHFEDFSRGVLDVRRVVFFLSVAGISLWGAVLAVEGKRG